MRAPWRSTLRISVRRSWPTLPYFIAFHASPCLSCLAPYLARDAHHQFQLTPLFGFGNRIPMMCARESALRRQTQTLHRHIRTGGLDAPFDLIGAFDRALLRRDQTEHR